MAAQRTLMRWLLGREIAHMLTEAGKTYDDAGEILKLTRNRVAELIEGTRTITVGDLERLVNRLGFGDVEGYLDRLEKLRAGSNKRGYWNEGYNRAYPEELRMRVEMEKACDLIKAAQVEIVPGLLQCPEYIRALHGNTPPPHLSQGRSDVTLDDYVEARMARQQILRTPGTEFRAVLSESCLIRRCVDAHVMRQQCQYLLEMSELPDVSIQVLKFDTPLVPADVGNPFATIRVPTPGIAGPLDVIYSEGRGKITYDDTKDSVLWGDSVWSRLSSAAMNTEDSRRYIRYIADRHFSS